MISVRVPASVRDLVRAAVELGMDDTLWSTRGVAEAFEAAAQPAAVVTSDVQDMARLVGLSNTPGVSVATL